MKKKKPALVRLVDFLKRKTGLFTYQIEFFVVGIILGLVVISKEFHIVEIIGAAAVFFSFAHAKVANRLEEREAHRAICRQEATDILPYYYKISRYFYIKEALWLLYFVFLGAWSALIGVGIFLVYPSWRKLWRRYYPLDEKIRQEVEQKK